MRMNILRRLFCAFFWLCSYAFILPQSSSADAVTPSDLNGDGTSDITLISIQGDQSLSWSVYSGANAALLGQQASFGKAGNNIISANWLSDTSASLGYVAVGSNGKSVSWVVLDSQGAPISKKFGSKLNTFISGADFNGDGIADAAVISVDSKGRFNWTIKQDLFASRVTKLQALNRENAAARANRAKLKKALADLHVTFGSGSDVPFYVNPDGKGDVLAVLKKDKAGNYYLVLRSPFSRKNRRVSLSVQPTGTSRPVPIAQADGSDILAFRTSDTALKFMNLSGDLLVQATLPGSGELLVGNFNELPGQEVAIQTQSGFSVYNPNSISDVRTMTLPSGISIDDINITKFTSGGGGTGGGGTGGGGNSGCSTNGQTPTGGLADVCSVVFPMNSCVLYKPGSGGTADARTGKPAFLWYNPLDNPNVDNLQVYAANGQKVAQFGFYFPAPAPLVRFYSGYGGGTGESGPQLASKATSASGKPWLYFLSTNGRCWGPVTNPNGRSGGK